MNSSVRAGAPPIGPWLRRIAAACAALLVCAQPVMAQAPTPVPGENAVSLVKEDFETGFANDDSVCPQGGCQVPKGWGAWFVGRRDSDPEGTNLRPQLVQSNNPRRVKTGAGAQRIYVENGTFTGGLYRVVTNVKAGSKLRISMYGMAWSTNDENPISSRPSRDIRLRIGIDPQGGDNGKPDPTGAQVIWSSEQESKDAYSRFVVEAEARSSTVIIYTYATMRDVVRHNEAFWDDAIVETISALPPTTTPTAAPNVTAGPSPTPAPTLTPTPKPGVRYIVKSGDTLASIALQYNKTVEELRRINRISGELLQVDQELIIELPTQTGPVPTAVLSQTTVLSGTVVPGVGVLCLSAFFDRNGNGLRDTEEDLVPNIPFSVSSGATVIRSYTSDGVNEPFCITSMQSGNYRAAVAMPAAYLATTPLNNLVNVPGGGVASFAVGLRRVTDGNRVATSAPAQGAAQQAIPGILAALAAIAGLALLIGAIGLGISLLLRRRRI